MFIDFVLNSKQHKAIEFYKAISNHINIPKEDFLDYMRLAEQSESHKHDSIDTVFAEVALPMLHENYILIRDNAQPVAYASWGFFSKDISNKLETGRYLLTAKDHNSGNQTWILDVISPYGKTKQLINLMKQIRENLKVTGTIRFRRFDGANNKERIGYVYF